MLNTFFKITDMLLDRLQTRAI